LCHEVKRKALGTQRGTTINLQQVGGCAMKLRGKHWTLSVIVLRQLSAFASLHSPFI